MYIRISLLAMVILAISACDDAFKAYSVSDRQWTEDVLLADGELIRVERSVQLKETSALGGGGYNAVELEATLQFSGDLAHLPKWSVPLRAQVLYKDDETRQWVIVATTTSCEVMYERAQPRFWYADDRPPTLYFEFRLRDNGWTQVPLSRSSIGRATNLLGNYKPIKTSHVSAAMKQRLESDSRPADEYLHVVERPEHNCMTHIDTLAAWEAEDRVFAALEREHATPEQRARVGELLASTRLLFQRPETLDSWTQDLDSGTVQIVQHRDLNGGRPGVSEDGQVIYYVIHLYPVLGDLIKESYARRLSAAGFRQVAQ